MCSHLERGSDSDSESTANQQQYTIKMETGSKPKAEETPNLPENKRYSEQQYWDDRFAKESQYEWLASYPQIKSEITPFIEKDAKILILGCGNSPFSFDLYNDGYKNITNIDYSANVIENMINKDKDMYGGTEPMMTWKVVNMIHMDEFSNESFDVVVDKAGIDAILTNEGDVWNPNEQVIEDVFQVCSHISRMLSNNGYFLSVSFMQPHFRKKYFLDMHQRSRENDDGARNSTKNGLDFCNEYQWSLTYSETGDGTSGFPNYLYIMQKNC